MEITETVLLCVALSIDAFTVGITCGFEGIRVGWRPRAVMLMVSVMATGAAVAAGVWLGAFVPDLAGRIAGSCILFLLGLFMLYGGYKKRRGSVPESRESRLPLAARMLGDPDQCDPDNSLSIDCREALVIGGVISADSVAAGLSAGMSGGAVYLVPLMCGVFQAVLFYIGEKAAGRLRRRNGDHWYFSVFSGIILILTGLIRLAV